MNLTVQKLEMAFLRLYDELRSIDVLRGVTILYVFENMLGQEQGWLDGLIRRTTYMTNVFVLYENDKALGFKTTELSKIQAYDILAAYCSNGGVQFFQDLITIDTERRNGRVDVRNLLIDQIQQLKQFGRKMASGRSVRVVSAIHSEDWKRIPNCVDDAVMAFSMGLRVAMLYYQRKLPLPYATIFQLRTRAVHREERLSHMNREIIASTRLNKDRRTAANEAGMFSA